MRPILFSIIFSMLVILVFTHCRTDVLNEQEKQLIMSGSADEPMNLFTINVETDSLLLRQKARKIKNKEIGHDDIQLLKKRMLATVTDSTNVGVGIAAPQVGVSISMIYVQRFDKPNEPFEIYYNPVIIQYGDSINSGLEGCLSIPGFRGKVDRSQNIVVSYLDSLGKMQKETINDFTAVIFQHEIDHIEGVFYFDHIYNGFDALNKVEE